MDEPRKRKRPNALSDYYCGGDSSKDESTGEIQLRWSPIIGSLIDDEESSEDYSRAQKNPKKQKNTPEPGFSTNVGKNPSKSKPKILTDLNRETIRYKDS